MARYFKHLQRRRKKVERTRLLLERDFLEDGYLASYQISVFYSKSTPDEGTVEREKHGYISIHDGEHTISLTTQHHDEGTRELAGILKLRDALNKLIEVMEAPFPND